MGLPSEEELTANREQQNYSEDGPEYDAEREARIRIARAQIPQFLNNLRFISMKKQEMSRRLKDVKLVKQISDSSTKTEEQILAINAMIKEQEQFLAAKNAEQRQFIEVLNKMAASLPAEEGDQVLEEIQQIIYPFERSMKELRRLLTEE